MAFAFFVGELEAVVLPPLIKFMKAAGGLDFKRLVGIMGALVFLFVALVVMATAAIPLAIFNSFFLRGIVESGFEAVGDMATSMLDYLAPAIKSLNAIKVDDPAALEAKINALVAIFEAVGLMGDLVFKIALLDVIASANGGESGAILEGASDFMDSMMEGAEGLIRALAQIVSTMKEGDIKKLEAIGGVLGAIANLMTALQPPPGLMDAISDLGGGLFTDADPQAMQDVMKSYGDMVGSIMTSIKASIVPMITDLMAIDLGPDPEAAKTKAEAIGAAIDAVVKMATGFGAMASDVMAMNQEQQGFFGSGESVTKTLNDYMSVMDMIMGSIKAQIPGIVTAIMSAADQITDPEGAKAKLEVVGLAMSALSDFAGAISSMSGQIPEPGWFESSEDVLDQFMDTVRTIVNVAVRYIPTIVSQLTAIPMSDPAAAKAKLEVVALSMNAINQFVGVIGRFGGESASDIWEKFKGPIKGFAWLFGYESDGTGNTIPELMTTITSAEVGDPGTIQAKLEGLNGAMNGLNSFVGSFGAFASSMENIEVEALTNAGSSFQLIMDNMAQINEALASGLPTVDLVATLDQFGEAMSISGESISVENKPININVSFSVNMNARNIATALSDATIAGSAALLTAGSEGAA